jgi:glutaredoxin
MKSVVTIYTKRGCHLCDVAKTNILAAASGREFTLEEIDIETDEQLYARYRYDIPVVLINGIKAFKHSVDVKEFKRKLERLAEKNNKS